MSGRGVVLRCVLLIAAWQGPIPWCHCHGTLANSHTQASSWLAAHLRSHHPVVAPLSNVFFGWHMHADFPDSSEEESGRPTNRRHNLLPMNSADCLSVSLVRESAETSARMAPAIASQHGGVATVIRTQSLVSAHFFDAFAPTLPLPMRFCVSRC